MDSRTWNPNGHADAYGDVLRSKFHVNAYADPNVERGTWNTYSAAYPDLDAAAADGYLYRHADSPHGHTNGDTYLANSYGDGYAHTPYVHTDDCAHHTSRHTDVYPTSHLTATRLVCRGHTLWTARLPRSARLRKPFASARKSALAATLAQILRY